MRISILIYLFIAINIFSSNNFNVSKEIKIEGNDKYYKLLLDKDIYKHSKNDLNDIRIFDKNMEIIPYYIEDDFLKKENIFNVHEVIIQNAYRKNKDFHLEIEVKGVSVERDIWINSLEFLFDHEEFYSQIELYGSYDKNTWVNLSRDKLYNVDNKIKSIIEFERSKFQFYKVIFLESEKDIAVKTIKAVENLIKNQDYYKIEEVHLDYEVEEEEDNKTKIRVKNQYLLPLIRLEIEAEGNYKRKVYIENYDYIFEEIYSFDYNNQNSKKNDLYVYNLPRQENFVLVIENGDNRKLNLKKIKFFTKSSFLVLENIGEKPYKLYIGQESLGKPNYDLYDFISSIDIEKLSIGQLGAPQMIKVEEVKKDFFDIKTKKLILNLIILIVSSLMIVIVIRNIKRK